MALSLFIVTESFSQVTELELLNLFSLDDFGSKTIHDIKDEIEKELLLIPCKLNSRQLGFTSIYNIKYCLNDITNINFQFHNNILGRLTISSKLTSKSQAESVFSESVRDEQLNQGIEPEILNYGINGVKYHLTPTGEPDLFKVPLVDKERALLMEELAGEAYFEGAVVNKATFSTPTSRVNRTFSIAVKFSENEIYFVETWELRPEDLEIVWNAGDVGYLKP